MQVLLDHREELLAGFWLTIKLALAGALGSLVLGTVLAAMRVSPVPVLRTAAGGTRRSRWSSSSPSSRSAPTWG
jgi:ABC-type amino acid transport system permease subunit